MNSLLISQIVCIILLLVGTFFFGTLPIFVKKYLFACDCVGATCKNSCKARKGKLITAFLIYFGGGVLLGTCLLHLLPESREGFEEHHGNSSVVEEADDDHHEHFPLPEFIVCCGFFAVYLFEEIVHFFLGGHTHVPTETKAIRSFSRSSSCASPDARLSISDHHKLPTTMKVEPANNSEVGLTEKFSVAALLTVAALSFHSLFEGFAVGLRPDAVSTWVVFAAISVHKYVIAFVVGLEVLADGGKNIQVYVYMTVFSLMSPLGMGIAMITQSNVEDSNPLTVSVLNAIATGTLLYVTFFEILQREENKDISTWIQLIATASGFALMCIMQYASTFA
ncbi:zinc transporter ZIP1-like [Uloborus diversus]|uniref:zinc transporter ZIP1-like n=1 Tax=Uloborus diversus TaxID=327109 RepID=UPI002409307F|nr:zinc transporter ZIP1-like [Uloborus diversus]